MARLTGYQEGNTHKNNPSMRVSLTLAAPYRYSSREIAMKSYRVAEISEFDEGRRKLVEINGRSIALIQLNGTIHAIDNVCQHKGGSLIEGEICGSIIECPWHGWGYDLVSGECTYDPNVRQGIHSVTVKGNDVYITLNDVLR